MPFYAVAFGRKPGIYSTWEECCTQVHKFKAAKFKKFKTKEEANQFIKDNEPKKNINNSNMTAQLFTLGATKIVENNQNLNSSKIKNVNQKSPIKSAESLESIIVEKVINKKSTIKHNLPQLENDDTIILSDDEEIESSSIDKLESNSIIILDDDISSKSSNKNESINNKIKTTNISQIATRMSPRKLTKHKFINDLINNENKNKSQINPFITNQDFISFNSSNNQTNNPKNNQSNNPTNSSTVNPKINPKTKQSNSNRVNKGHVVVYTDGACSNNGFKNARAGIGVWWGKNDSRNISEPLSGKATNNRAEIWAAIRAINKAADDGYDSVQICTDSDFLIKSAKHWVYSWEKNGWHLTNNKKVANKDDFIELIKAMERIKVVWEKVKSHIGIPGNEAADKLAVQGMNKQK